MLAIKPARVLAHRGIATSASRSDMFNWGQPEKRDSNQFAYLNHPNRNIDNYETFRYPFPFAPRFADQDHNLNQLRDKAKGAANWGDLSVEEQKALYHGHFRCAMHVYTVNDDHWKFYFGLWGMHLGVFACLLKYYTTILEVEHQEYLNDEHWVIEWYKASLQYGSGPYTGMAANYDYVNKTWRERFFMDSLVRGHFFICNWRPHDVRDGVQMGFTYLNPSKK